MKKQKQILKMIREASSSRKETKNHAESMDKWIELTYGINWTKVMYHGTES